MKLVHLHDGEATDVAVEALGEGRFRIQIGERTLEVEGSAVEQGVALRVGGRSLVVPIDARGDATYARIAGRRQRVELEDARVYQMKAALGLAAGGASDQLSSPMTGKVVVVSATPGATAAAGDTLVIIEAMKMENELRADADCVVAEVFVAPGDLVNPGDPLVRFASQEEA